MVCHFIQSKSINFGLRLQTMVCHFIQSKCRIKIEKCTLKQIGLPLGKRAPLNEIFLQIRGVSSFIWDLFGKHSEMVITLNQNIIVFKRDLPLSTKEGNEGVPSLIIFSQKRCSIIHLENIWKTF